MTTVRTYRVRARTEDETYKNTRRETANTEIPNTKYKNAYSCKNAYSYKYTKIQYKIAK